MTVLLSRPRLLLSIFDFPTLRRKRLGHGGGMMCKIVVDRHAIGSPDHFEPTLHARKSPQSLSDSLGADADLGRYGYGGQRVPHVVRADERHIEYAERRPAASDTKARRRASRFQIMGLPVDVVAKTKRFDARDVAPSRPLALSAPSSGPRRLDQPDQPSKASERRGPVMSA